MVEHRRSQRKRADATIPVNNAITGQIFGRIGNLSIDGMMLMTHQPVVEDALFQFAFQLPGRFGHSHTLEIGVHEQWTESAQAPGQFWAGFRIIDISPEDYNVLYDWINTGEGRFQ